MYTNLGAGDEPKKRTTMPPRMAGKKPGVDLMVAVGVPKNGPAKPPMDAEESQAHEAAESPAQEGAEDYGAKLMSDLEAVGAEYGASPEMSREIAAKMFRAMADCLSGGGQEKPPMMGAEEGA